MRPAGAARRTTLLALATACVIACYTLIDGAGVRRSGAGVTMWLFVRRLVVALVARRRGLLPFARAILILFARRHVRRRLGMPCGDDAGAVALVAALRETSILFATAIAALVLRERISRTRLLAVGLIAGGACAMRLA